MNYHPPASRIRTTHERQVDGTIVSSRPALSFNITDGIKLPQSIQNASDQKSPKYHSTVGSLSPNLQPLSDPSVKSSAHQEQQHQQPHSIRIFGNKYVIIEPIETCNLYKCINKETLQEYVCRIVSTSKYQQCLQGYIRMDGNPGINSVEEIIITPTHTFLVFSPSYEDLHSYVRNKKRLKEPEAAKLFRQIVSIVADCHSNGVVLMDLKLRKFVFKDVERTQLKLETLDDVIVLDNPEDDFISDKHGCLAYVSPEIVSCHSAKYSGKSADCWSLGVILYTLLVGRYPFHDSDTSLLINKIREGFFQIPNSLSPLVKCMIRSLLRSEPSERITAEELLSCKWFDLMSSGSTSYSRYHSSIVNCSSDNSEHNGRQLPNSNQIQSSSQEENSNINSNDASISKSRRSIRDPGDQCVPDLVEAPEAADSSSFFEMMSFTTPSF